MTSEEITKMMLESCDPTTADPYHNEFWTITQEELERFTAKVLQVEREAIVDEWWMCVQADLENGVKSLNEQAAKRWRKEYPSISEFGEFIDARGEST